MSRRGNRPTWAALERSTAALDAEVHAESPPLDLLPAARDAYALLVGLLTDSQLDHVQPDGTTARQRLDAIGAAITRAESEGGDR